MLTASDEDNATQHHTSNPSCCPITWSLRRAPLSDQLLLPSLTVQGPSDTSMADPGTGPLQTSAYQRSNVSFAAVDGTQLDAWLYLPNKTRTQQNSSSKPPVVLMGHGELRARNVCVGAYVCCHWLQQQQPWGGEGAAVSHGPVTALGTQVT